MDCVEVRERLTDHALAALPPDERAFVQRHLGWCAGCRKEAAELEEAAAVVGLSLVPAAPPRELEERIVGQARRVAGAGRGGHLRRSIRMLTAATAVAVVVAILGVGWGAAMFARVQNEQTRATRAQMRAERLAHRVDQLINSFLSRKATSRGPHELATEAELGPEAGRHGGGGAVVFTSPTRDDWILVVLGGMARRGLPYRVQLRNDDGTTLSVGRIDELDSDGGAEIWRPFELDLSSFTTVVVKDRAGASALTGIASSPGDQRRARQYTRSPSRR